MDELFERELGDRLRADAEFGVRPWNSAAIAAAVSRQPQRRFGWRWEPAPVLRSFAIIGMVIILVATLGVIGAGLFQNVTQPVPTLPVNPVPTSVPSPSTTSSVPSPSATSSGPPSPTAPPTATPLPPFSSWQPSTFALPGPEEGGSHVAGVVEFHGEYLAIGSSDRFHILTWASSDGADWSLLEIASGDADLDVWSVAANDERVLAVGPGGAAISTDGRSWSGAATPDQFSEVTALPNLFIAASREHGGSIWTSPDGTDWTKVANAQSLVDGAAGAQASIFKLRTFQVGATTVVIAVGLYDLTPDNFDYVAGLWVARDAEATNWTREALGIGGHNTQVADVAQSSGNLMAVGTEGYCCLVHAWTSADAATWSEVDRPVPGTSHADSAAGTASGFLVIGGSGPLEFRGWSASADGQSWASIGTPETALTTNRIQLFDQLARPDGAVIIVATHFSFSGSAINPVGWIAK